MFRSMLAITLSAALVFAPVSVTPARADEDVAKVLAGIAGLIILKEALDRRDERRARTRNPAPVQASPHRRATRSYQRRAARVAPQRCLRDQWTHRGWRQVYGARCMERHARYQAPRACLRRATASVDGPRRFYTKRCLRNHGWRL